MQGVPFFNYYSAMRRSMASSNSFEGLRDSVQGRFPGGSSSPERLLMARYLRIWVVAYEIGKFCTRTIIDFSVHGGVRLSTFYFFRFLSFCLRAMKP